MLEGNVAAVIEKFATSALPFALSLFFNFLQYSDRRFSQLVQTRVRNTFVLVASNLNVEWISKTLRILSASLTTQPRKVSYVFLFLDFLFINLATHANGGLEPDVYLIRLMNLLWRRQLVAQAWVHKNRLNFLIFGLLIKFYSTFFFEICVDKKLLIPL